MQFVGIGFRKSDRVDLELIRDKAAEYDLLASKTFSEGNFKEGLEEFADHFELDLLQLAAYNADDRKASSRQVSDELLAFQENPGPNSFLDFMTDAQIPFPGTYYLVFACDWQKPDPVRLERLAAAHLKPYFERNASWYLWLYNYSAKRHYSKLDVPLVLEINT